MSDLYLLLRAGRPPQYVTFPLNDLSVASPRQLLPDRLLQYLTFPLCHDFGKTAPRVLVEFLPCCYVRHAHTMASKTVYYSGL